MTDSAISRATYSISQESLEFMLLDKMDYPQAFHGHQILREGPLDNNSLAEHGFAGSTAERFSSAGRVTGAMREFGPTSAMGMEDGFDFMAATVAHLFDSPESVTGWMHEIFLKDFETNVGEGVGQGHQLISSEKLTVDGFFDESVALRVLQGGPLGVMSSTVVDFRVGRVLGVAFVGTVGDHTRLELATQLGLALEKRIVGVVLGA